MEIEFLKSVEFILIKETSEFYKYKSTNYSIRYYKETELYIIEAIGSTVGMNTRSSNDAIKFMGLESDYKNFKRNLKIKQLLNKI